MKSYFRPICFLLLALFLSGCSTTDIFSEQSAWRGDVNDPLRAIGASNAVKKAYQMADVVFYPKADFSANSRNYSAGTRYTGLVYSSVKEINTYIGTDVSFHTFMTAVNNPKSKLYTERLNESPYHGINCRAYYGTVCSGLVSFALGLKDIYSSYDFAISEKMYTVPEANADSIMVADVIWQSGHVALVTQVLRDSENRTIEIEITEAIQSGVRRKKNSAETINQYLSGSKRLLRYRNLDHNTEYIPQTNFVAVEGEVLQNFQYNDDICPDKGDKSCYRTDENIILNTSKAGMSVEIYKDEMLINVLNSNAQGDVVLGKCEKGNYMARVATDGYNHSFVYWKVLDLDVRVDRANSRVYFNSSNSRPVYFEFCSIEGARVKDYKKVNTHLFTNEELQKGYIDVEPPSDIKDNNGRTYTYVKVHFECEYGRVINQPIEWYSSR